MSPLGMFSSVYATLNSDGLSVPWIRRSASSIEAVKTGKSVTIYSVIAFPGSNPRRTAIGRLPLPVDQSKVDEAVAWAAAELESRRSGKPLRSEDQGAIREMLCGAIALIERDILRADLHAVPGPDVRRTLANIQKVVEDTASRCRAVAR